MADSALLREVWPRSFVPLCSGSVANTRMKRSKQTKKFMISRLTDRPRTAEVVVHVSCHTFDRVDLRVHVTKTTTDAVTLTSAVS